MLQIMEGRVYSYVKKNNGDNWSAEEKTYTEFCIADGKGLLQDIATELLEGEDKVISFDEDAMFIEYDIYHPDLGCPVGAYDDIRLCSALRLSKEWHLKIDTEKEYQLMIIDGTSGTEKLTKFNCPGGYILQRFTEELDEEECKTISDVIITSANNLRIQYNNCEKNFKEFNIIEL